MKYNEKTNKVETDINVVIAGLKAEKSQKEEIITLAKNNQNEYNYIKIYGEKECIKFECVMWKNKTLVSTLYSKDANGIYKEFAWKE